MTSGSSGLFGSFKPSSNISGFGNSTGFGNTGGSNTSAFGNSGGSNTSAFGNSTGGTTSVFGSGSSSNNLWDQNRNTTNTFPRTSPSTGGFGNTSTGGF